MSIAAVNIAGLLFNLAGVLVLFQFGMPFKIRSEGKTPRTFVLADAEALRAEERLYEWLGWLGLTLIVIGTVLQIAANLL